MEPVPATARELAEALWLAEQLAAWDPAAAAAAAGSQAADPPTGQPEPTPPPEHRTPADPGTETEQTALVQRHSGRAPAEDSGRRPLIPLRLPAPREIRQPTPYLRALRPLRQSTPSSRQRLLDETETVLRSAEIRRLFPVLRAQSERYLDLLIAVDQGPSMVLWRQLVAELRTVFSRLAAFRTIQVATLTDETAARARVARDRSGRLVVLVLSDCVGAAWRDGTAQRMLASRGRRGPVAVLNPLPRRLWDRTAVGTGEVLLRAHRRGQPNRTLHALRARPGWQTEATGGVLVPILGLQAEEVAGWAGLVAGRPGPGAWITVLADHAHADAATATAVPDTPPGRDPDQPEPGSPAEAVGTFAGSAAPAAFRLAGLLATARLTLPAMRAVHYLAEGETGSAHLAEVFLSGLIEESGTEPGEYDFAPGVRAALLATIRRSDAVRIAVRLDEWIGRSPGSLSASTGQYIESDRGTAIAAGSSGYVPFASLPAEVLRIVGGGFARERPGVLARWEGRVILLGEGAAGKTSLANSLVGREFDPTEPTTHGVRVNELRFAHPDQAEVAMRMKVWDFGGQDIYHATHQFFLTDESIYLLVWSSRMGWEASRLAYWLRLISARAPRSAVLVVATHASDRPVDLPASDLSREFPQIRGFLSVDNADGTGIDLLRRQICTEAVALPSMGARWPVSWLAAMRAVENSPERYLSRSQLLHTMAEAGLTDADEQLQVARALHGLGSILYFADEEALAEIAVLRPEWLVMLIARVLDDPEVERQQGVLRRARLRKIWPDLDPALREHFLDLMGKFDLAYRIGGEFGDDGVCLVVERLPWNPPERWREVWEGGAAVGTGDAAESQIRMVYALDSATPGIPSWFIARTHRFSAGIAWRNGAVLAHPDGLHRGLIRGDQDREEIELTVRGPSPNGFFAILDDILYRTLEHYPGLSFRRLIPCRCEEGCPERFDYDNLQRRMTAGRYSVECPRSMRDVYVPRLLLGLRPDDPHTIRSGLDRLEGALTWLEDSARRSEALVPLRYAEHATCPRVFTLTPLRSRFITGTNYRLTLFCEQPGSWHPLPADEGRYRIKRPPDWLRRLSPYLDLLIPVLGSQIAVAGQAMADLELMRTIVPQVAVADAAPGARADIRALEELLHQVDPDRHWGGLIRVHTPEGLPIYVCSEHARLYHTPLPDPS